MNSLRTCFLARINPVKHEYRSGFSITIPRRIILLACLLRLYKLDSEVIWYDEADSNANATRHVSMLQDPNTLHTLPYCMF